MLDEKIVYEYWCDGERVSIFSDLQLAKNHYRVQSMRHPERLHTIMKVVPMRKVVIQWVP